jgi:fructokinase
MPDIVTMGESLIDFLSTERGVLIEETRGFTIAPGGAPANVAAAVAKLGGSAGFVGKVGKDSFGIMIRNTLLEAGVNVDHVIMDRSVNTTLAFISVKTSGEPDFVFYRNHCGADLALKGDEIERGYIGESAILHFGSISFTGEPLKGATIRAIEIARSSGSILSFDPNLRPTLWESMSSARAEIERGLQYADIVKLTDVELEFITGTNNLPRGTDSLLKYGPRMVFITRGKNSCYFNNGELSLEFPTFEMELVDATGAGDAFMGGVLLLLNSRLRNGESAYSIAREEIEKILRFANACGAITVTRKGVIPALPTKAEVDAFLSDH